MIFVSAGHYPAKPGARYERFVEHDEAVVWADLLCKELEEDGMAVPTGFLQSKVDFINERVMEGDVAVEIHFNAATHNGMNVGRGSESLYYPGSGRGKRLAEVCQSVLADYFSPNRGVKEGWYRLDPSNGPIFFLARTRCPAVILEPEFIHRLDGVEDKRNSAIIDLSDKLLTEYVDGNNS